MELIDTHAHLDEEAFAADRDEVLRRAAEAGVSAVVTIGITAETSRRAVALAAHYENVFAAVGIQPNYAAAAAPGDWDEIERLAAQPGVVGVGETGLDRYWDYAPLDVQEEFFERHLDLARRLGLPFVVHCREAEADVVRLLRAAARGGTLAGVMHSFSGDPAAARSCLDLGLHVSFAGMVTYKKNDELRQVAASVPEDRLLLETDAPYLVPLPLRGKLKRNEPAHLRHTAEVVAAARDVPLEELAALTTRNARALFRLPPRD